jgi:4-amino-4-deoxy-L-arabinose transferase-like glycosyltransferase
LEPALKKVEFNKANLILAGILLLAVCWKVLLLAMDIFPFNADEAVVGLMGRHILGGALPIFFYGQAYMGSLDAFLVAGGFAIFGQQVWVIRLVQIVLYLGTIFTTMLLGKRIKGQVRTGIIAGLLLAIPTVNVTLYTTVSLGGYGEALLLGNLIILSGLHILDDETAPSGSAMRMLPWLLGWAFLVGLGLWANGITLIYSLPMGLLLAWRLIKQARVLGRRGGIAVLVVLLFGFLLGSLPWWLHALQNGLDFLLRELSGSAVAVESGTWWQRSLIHLQNLLLLGGTVIFGFRPPWEVRWLALPLLPILLTFWCAVVFSFMRSTRSAHPEHRFYRIWLGVGLTLCAGFVFTSFGVDPSGRYFLPLAVPLALASAEMVPMVVKQVRWQALVVALVMLYQGWGTIDCAFRYPPGITTQFDATTVIDHRTMPELIDFLQTQGETRGYTNYWIAYPLAFNSQEQLIYVPRLPYHQDLRYTTRDDRYAPYDEVVGQSDRVAYITSNTPVLDA